jgi:hypothetical protein
MMPTLRPLLLLLLLAAAPPPLPYPLPGDPGAQCRAAIAAAERSFAIPAGLMAAIGVVESGRRGPDGRIDPWPWSIDAEGSGQTFATRAQAVAAVQALQARGVRSIDVGCMQVNLLHHPDAFPTLDAAFDPATNAAYAARFLRTLHAQAGTWPDAAALYHSATPALAGEYRRKVMAAWPAGLAAQADAAPTDAAPAGAPGALLPAVGGVGPGGIAAARLLARPPPAARPPAMPALLAGRTLASYRLRPIPVAGN